MGPQVGSIGIDVSGVIVERSNGKTEMPFDGALLEVAPVEGAFEAIARINCDIFEGRVFVISKCGSKSQKKKKTLQWMDRLGFFRMTGIPPEQVFFCRKREEKAAIARKLKLTHFIDDRLETLGYLKRIVKNRFLFQGRADEIQRYERHLKDIVRVESWSDVLDALGVIPPEDKICTCARDEDGRCNACIEKASAFVRRLVQFQKDVKRTLERTLAELAHPCRACDREYYDYALAKVVREVMTDAAQGREAELGLVGEVIQMFVGIGRGHGVAKFPLTEKAWEELVQGKQKSGG